MTYRFFLILLVFVFCCTSVFCQNNYERAWKKVDSLINRGLTRSAIDEVDKIYASAKKNGKNDGEIIKSLIYKLSLDERINDDPLNAIKTWEKEAIASTEPTKSILRSIEAEAYWNYFMRNRTRLYNRTETTNFKKDDIATWGVSDFHKKISQLYLESLHDEKLLQETRLEPFDAAIRKGNVRYLRPTLFDLLTHRALEYFKNDEPDVTNPSLTFELSDPAVFADRNIFIAKHFTSHDSLSLHFKALLLFQRLIRFHLNDSKPDAMLDVDIERIEFAWSYGIMDNAGDLYIDALKNITTHFDGNNIANQAWYLQAQQFANKAVAYDANGDTSNRYSYLDAKSICERVIQSKDSSIGKANCEYLLKQILRKELQFQIEKVNVPQQPFRILLTFKNFTILHGRIIKLDSRIKQQLGNQNWTDEYWKKLIALPALKTISQQLPDTRDHQRHSVEIKIDALDPGEYILLASTMENFPLKKNILSAQSFYVSNIAYIETGSDYFVLNRETGQPLQGTDVQVWYNYYDSRENKYRQRKGEQFITDKNGFFHITGSKQLSNNEIQLELTRSNDHLMLENERSYFSYNRNADYRIDTSKNEYERKNLSTYLFMDRSIYRPGQTLYFKGIVITKDFQTRKYKIIPAFKTKVSLFDANDEKIDSVFVTTNEYGSFHGSFRIPEGHLNGEFMISEDSTNKEQPFAVEEYKRPKFEITYDTVKGAYRLNDEIKITGRAAGFAGNNITNATVKYRVSRYVQMDEAIYRFGPRMGSKQEIAHGEVSTDDNGKFKIQFKAIPDRLVKKETNPTFIYEITADITDMNGETHSAETTVQVKYQAVIMSIEYPVKEEMLSDSFRYLFIKTQNSSGLFEQVKINVRIYQIAGPSRLIRSRYWQQPDLFVMTKDEYEKYFPHDEYHNESNKETWKKIKKVFDVSDTTGLSNKIRVSDLTAGWYAIEVTGKDQFGDDLKSVKYLQLSDGKTNRPPSPAYSWNADSYQYAKPGDNVRIDIGSSANDIFVIEQKLLSKQDADNTNGSYYSYLSLSNESKTTRLPITESEKGGFNVFCVFVKDNRVYTVNNSIFVNWTDKQLSLSYETYRDKTLPGSKEKWKIKISGNKNSLVAAEMLTSMYDASLDQFKKHNWTVPDLYPVASNVMAWNGRSNFFDLASVDRNWNENNPGYYTQVYDRLILQSLQNVAVFNMRTQNGPGMPKLIQVPDFQSDPDGSKGIMRDSGEMFVIAEKMEKINPQSERSQETAPIQIRKNFSETAFFFPDLQTDSSGNVEFSFTMPEALTQWKWMTFAHTKDLSMGYDEKTIITQKQLMVQPNAPRFLREGDKIEFSTKIVNMTDTPITGSVKLQLIDPFTNQTIDTKFNNTHSTQNFSTSANQSININFPFNIPENYSGALTYRIVATGRDMNQQVSDGEENTLPVLGNRTLVMESLPLNMNSSGTKKFRFEKLLQSANSKTLANQSLTVEFTSNPAWYAVQSLPYMIEYPYECSEQTFNRFYANALASIIANSSPRIKEIFEHWKNTDTAALLSNLQKNEEIKSVLLEETPWVVTAKNESTQKKNIALLFDMMKMNAALESAFSKLQQMQLENGGFTWFKDGPDNRYITQYILSGIGHLKKLKAIPTTFAQKINPIVSTALAYMDRKIIEDYSDLQKRRKKDVKINELTDIQIQYLYVRSFFNEYAVPGNLFSAMNYYRQQSQKLWLQESRYMQGLIALSLFRTGDIKTANEILASLKQNAIVNDEMGMYWKDVRAGYYWYESPIETQSLLIEAFSEIKKDDKITAGLKTWLLKQKQTQNWGTTKATADACYALLLQGANLLAESNQTEIALGDKNIDSKKQSSDAGTGYFKTIIPGDSVKPAYGDISVTVLSSNPNKITPSWGAVYWQYFENMDKIASSSETKMPLTLSKKLFIERNTDRGTVLEPIADNSTLKVGDKIKVRIELRVDRDLEYVHMKDMRASSSEPINVISQYKSQNGLGYYESTKDASTNFFFSWLPKGTHVFEYPLFVTSAGNFSNGITTIQCMYAPEFSAHSDGIRITVSK